MVFAEQGKFLLRLMLYGCPTTGIQPLPNGLQDSPGFRSLRKPGGSKGELELLASLSAFAELRQDGAPVVVDHGIPGVGLGGESHQLLRSRDVALEVQEPPERVRRARASGSHPVGALRVPEGLRASARVLAEQVGEIVQDDRIISPARQRLAVGGDRLAQLPGLKIDSRKVEDRRRGLRMRRREILQQADGLRVPFVTGVEG